MPDNVLQTLQQLVQDVIAPDVRELKVRLSAFERQMDVRLESIEQKMDLRFAAVDAKFAGLDQKLTSLDQKNDAQFKAILAAIAESKAQAELTSLRVVAALSERVAVLESRSH